MKSYKKEVHRHYTVQSIALMVLVCLFAACVNRIGEEDMPDEKGHLSVKTCAGSTPLPYPVHIYAFDIAGKQAAVSTMKSADVALSSANAEANITLSHRMARIELSLRDIPAAVTAVKVSFSPLYNAVSFEGSGAGGGNTGTGGNTGGGGGTDGETPAPGENDTYTVAAIPAAGTLWNGHAVVAVQNTTAYNENGMFGWRIPTKDEADLIEKQCGGYTLTSNFNDLRTEAGGDVLTGNGSDSHGEDVRYLCEGATYTYSLKSTSESNTQAGGARTYYLRAVKTVHITTAH